MKVILLKFMGKESEYKQYAKELELPIQPFVGLGIVTGEEDEDPAKVESIFINYTGSVVCTLEEIVFPDELEVTEGESWQEIVDQMTSGWVVTEDGCVREFPK